MESDPTTNNQSKEEKDVVATFHELTDHLDEARFCDETAENISYQTTLAQPQKYVSDNGKYNY